MFTSDLSEQTWVKRHLCKSRPFCTKGHGLSDFYWSQVHFVMTKRTCIEWLSYKSRPFFQNGREWSDFCWSHVRSWHLICHKIFYIICKTFIWMYVYIHIVNTIIIIVRFRIIYVSACIIICEKILIWLWICFFSISLSFTEFSVLIGITDFGMTF